MRLTRHRCLTLAPVIGQRRSTPTEFRPAPEDPAGLDRHAHRRGARNCRVRPHPRRWLARPSANKGKRSRGGGGPRPSRPRARSRTGAVAVCRSRPQSRGCCAAWFPDSPQPGAAKRNPGTRPRFGTPNPNANSATCRCMATAPARKSHRGPRGQSPPRDHARGTTLAIERQRNRPDETRNRAQCRVGQRDSAPTGQPRTAGNHGNRADATRGHPKGHEWRSRAARTRGDDPIPGVARTATPPRNRWSRRRKQTGKRPELPRRLVGHGSTIRLIEIQTLLVAVAPLAFLGIDIRLRNRSSRPSTQHR